MEEQTFGSLYENSEKLGDIVEHIEGKEKDEYSPINDVDFEELEAIIKEYEKALEDKDKSKKNELNKLVVEKGYFDTVVQKIKDTIIIMQGCDPEHVEITFDGIVHIANKEQPVSTVKGPVATRKDGNPATLTYEQQVLIRDKIIYRYATSEKGVFDTAEAYAILLDVQKELANMNEKEDNVNNNDEQDIDER